MKIKAIYNSKFDLPKYEIEGSAGMDLRANIESDIILKPMERIVVPTGLSMSIPKGYEGQIRPRSGLAIKHGITILNSPGTIDFGYIGEIKLIIINLGENDYRIQPGDRIAQFVLNKYENVEFELVDDLGVTERGKNGFGHSGVK